MPVPHQALIKKASQKHGLNPKLVMAVARKESSLNTDAVRFEGDYQQHDRTFTKVYKWLYHPERFNASLGVDLDTEIAMQATSWGLMQVMGAVAREHGFAGPLHKLCRPDLGLEYGCLHLTGYLKKYGKVEMALAAYNGGPGAVNSDGTLDNQVEYVDPVMKMFVND